MNGLWSGVCVVKASKDFEHARDNEIDVEHFTNEVPSPEVKYCTRCLRPERLTLTHLGEDTFLR